MLDKLILTISVLLVLTCSCYGATAGGWTPWSELETTCSKPCGGGAKIKIRTCTNPSPENNGSPCLDESSAPATVETKPFDCNMQVCWDNKYTEWSNCSVECDIGEKNRQAVCGDEICIGTQAKEEIESCNTWVKATCPNPCLSNVCPKYAVCKDESTEEKPIPTCVCTMGYILTGELCIRPPPTIPTERPIPTLPAVQKIVATVISKTASTVLITCVTLTLIFFIFMKVFTADRVIQMNMEIALLMAHLLLLFPSSTSDQELLCRIISICLHLLFTAVFMFMLLEALHMYSLVANIVKLNGMFTKVQNIGIGWGVSIFIVLFTMCFEYDNYGGKYHCWVQLNKGVSMAEQIPIYVMIIITFTLIEAAGVADYKKLEGLDKDALMSAKFSQRTNLILLPLVYVHWILGILSEYQQNIALYSIFSLMNAILGIMVMLLHCSNSQMVRKRMKACFGKCCGKKGNDEAAKVQNVHY